MEKIIDANSSKDHYKANACIVWCFDNRFSEALAELVKSRGWSNYDLISIAGGAKALASPDFESGRSFVLTQIETSLKLHCAERIVLMLHIDCGAYGGSKAFGDDLVKETEFLKNELKKAKRGVYVFFRETPIELILADFNALWKLEEQKK